MPLHPSRPWLNSLFSVPLQAEDPTFLMALGSLTCLTELALGVAPARRTTRPFALNLASLQHLRALRVRGTGCSGVRRWAHEHAHAHVHVHACKSLSDPA